MGHSLVAVLKSNQSTPNVFNIFSSSVWHCVVEKLIESPWSPCMQFNCLYYSSRTHTHSNRIVHLWILIVSKAANKNHPILSRLNCIVAYYNVGILQAHTHCGHMSACATSQAFSMFRSTWSVLKLMGIFRIGLPELIRIFVVLDILFCCCSPMRQDRQTIVSKYVWYRKHSRFFFSFFFLYSYLSCE